MIYSVIPFLFLIWCIISVLCSLPHNHSEAIRTKLISSGILGSDACVVIAGPANTYAHYVTTREEYGVQRYEGASTIYGQCEPYILPYDCRSRASLAYVTYLMNECMNLVTLEAYIDKYSSLVPFLADNPSGTPPTDAPSPEQTTKAISLQVWFPIDLYFIMLNSDVDASDI